MKWPIIVAAFFVYQFCSSEEKDSAAVAQSKTKCMQLAKEQCRSAGMSGGFYYDAKHNRCYAICTSIGDGFITTTLDDVLAGEVMAIAVNGLADPSGVRRSSWGVIGKKRTSYQKAMDYINKMTKEPSDAEPAKK
jgi:hypothetical protein